MNHYGCSYRYVKREVRLRVNALWGCPWPHHVFGFVLMGDNPNGYGPHLLTIGLN